MITIAVQNSWRFAVAACLGCTAGAAVAEQVGSVDVDWLGKDTLIEAVADPKVAGVACRVACFDRGVIKRLQKGSWFEDLCDASVSCRQTGPITIGDIERDDEGENVFSECRSIV